MFKDLVRSDENANTAVLQLGSPVTFNVAMNGHNGLQLNCNYVRSAGTALTFTFTVQEIQDSNAAYSMKKTDVAGGTISSASFVYTTSATEKFSFVVPLTGRNVTVTVTGTATTNSDTIVIYPHCLVVG